MNVRNLILQWNLINGKAKTPIKLRFYKNVSYYPDEVKVNDTSLVTRVFLNGKRLFFPADISGEKGCRLLHEMYGSYLHSEYYQIAHHAWDTEALLFYDDVDPEVLFWPLRRKDWDPGNRMWTFPATKLMKAELDEGKRNFLIAMDENIQVEL